jgi:hypothetical protein
MMPDGLGGGGPVDGPDGRGQLLLVVEHGDDLVLARRQLIGVHLREERGLGVKNIEILVLPRTSMFALVVQTFGAKNLVKSLLISSLDKVIYYIGTFLQGLIKPLCTNYTK